MLGLDSLMKLLSELQSVFASRTAKKEKDAAKLEAISMVFRTAINETQIYLGNLALSNCEERDRKTEEDLSRKWAEAARNVRHVDAVLASDCAAMQALWALPDDRWSAESVRQLSARMIRLLDDGGSGNLCVYVK